MSGRNKKWGSNSNSRVAISQAYKSLSSANAKDFLVKVKRVSPFEIKQIQTDNGSEFYGLFDGELKDKTIAHLPEQFLNEYDDDLSDII